MARILDYIKTLPLWKFISLFVVLAIIFSEILVIIQSYILYGELHTDLLIIGFFTPAIDASVIFFITGLVLIQLNEKEQKLLDSQSILSQVQDHAQIGHWELLADQKTVHWSKQMYRLFGLPLDSKPELESLCDITFEGGFSIFLESIQNCFITGNEHQVEYQITRPADGEKRWIESKGKVITGSNGKFQKISGFIQDITERKETELIILQSEKRYGQIFESSLTEIFTFDAETYHFIKVNHGARENLGYDNEELLKLTDIDIKPDMSLEVFNNTVAPLRTGEKNIVQFETIHQRKDGTHYNVEVHLQLTELMGKSAFVAIILDITQRKKSEEKLKLASGVFTHARESIAITDDTGAIIDVNDTFITTTGYSREELIGQNPRILQSGRQSPEFYVEMWQALIKEGFWSGEIWNRRKNGEVYAEIKTISAVRNLHGITTHYVALGNDITPMKLHQNQLEHIAHYDVLTNLPNRSLLTDRLSQAISQCNRREQSLSVVFLDLDGFKAINDAYGHDIGDELLIALSLRMKEAIREGDSLARIGGDEFVAVLTNLTSVEDCEPVLERLLLAASEPVTVGDLVLNVSASIGVTLYPHDNVDGDQLMRHADQAMYVAKESGKNRYHLFDTAQDDAIKIQRESLEAIRIALDNHQFVLYYQPKVNMRTGTVVGVEALIR
jgi:diguanylate cyclase (GGDEF)-like protein/PAS domain S-box-containing protein